MIKFFTVEHESDSTTSFYGTNSIVSICKGLDPHAKEDGEHTIIRYASDYNILVVGNYKDVRKAIEGLSNGSDEGLVLKEYVIQPAPFVL
ncbi:hypothetical protein ORI89_07570 [Sphingobacterium sp. UT-1RO-CII-1]|uniref:hypothetical protein n=1 Tax=Sphingobacterium sp. UT-1RO-CII-1 TaxID=2995225 RepID=UPI00227B0BF2|nr:hypothetical protein [Sphingobacterium sp. UT-1RO-CII-1]MCY4779504.1 hypothetical protein [Sphingobacterium sp. UT-1RO-CII-1]